MERVKKGETYWYIYLGPRNVVVTEKVDYYNSTDDDYFRTGNYFRTKEEAESMARKLRAILNGADVIEMPSEGEIEDEAYENNHIHKERGDCNYPDDLCIESFIEGVNWLKSKIVK